MKKIQLLFLLLISAIGLAQTPTGREQSFPSGVKNPNAETISSPIDLVTSGSTGIFGRVPATTFAKTTDLSLKADKISGASQITDLNAYMNIGSSSGDTQATINNKVNNVLGSLVGGITYQGTWNASTNTPTITDSSGTVGQFYIVNVAGTTTINGVSTWNVGDWILKGNTGWQKVNNTDSVTSVNGKAGAVVLVTSDIAESGTLNRWYTPTREDLKADKVGGVGQITDSATYSNIGVASANSTQSTINAAINTSVGTLSGGKVSGNAPITGATNTKITYDSKGLVTAGSSATTVDINDTTDKRYQTDNQRTFNDATSSIQTQLNNKAANSSVVHLTGAESINGVKTFNASPIVPTPTSGTDAVNKTYSDLKVAKSDLNSNFNTPDGTGVKVATYDATEALQLDTMKIFARTGLADTDDETYYSYALNSTTLRIGAIKKMIFTDNLYTAPFDIPDVIKNNIPQMDYTLSSLGLPDVAGTYIRYFGYNKALSVVISAQPFYNNPSVAQLGYIVFSRTAPATWSFSGGGVVNIPKIAGYSRLEADTFRLLTSCSVTPKTGGQFSLSGGTLTGYSAGWVSAVTTQPNPNVRTIAAQTTANFILLNPTTQSAVSLPAPINVISGNVGFRRDTQTTYTVANGNAIVYKVLLARSGNIFFLTPESATNVGSVVGDGVFTAGSQPVAFQNAKDGVLTCQYNTSALPDDTYTTMGFWVITTTTGTPDLTNPTQCLFLASTATGSVTSTGTSVVDATTSVKGIVQLSGDIAGNATNVKVTGLNGTPLSGLSTGILKNTTSTGVPTIAIAGTDYQAPIGYTTANDANVIHTTGNETRTGSLTSDSFIKSGATGLNLLKDDGTSIAINAVGQVPSARVINTTSPLSGGGDLSADRTLSISQSSTSTDGYLSSTDWNTFNSKQSSIGYTPANDSNTMHLSGNETATGIKTFNDGKLGLRNTANTFTSFFQNAATASRIYTLPDVAGTVALTSNLVDASISVSGFVNTTTQSFAGTKTFTGNTTAPAFITSGGIATQLVTGTGTLVNIGAVSKTRKDITGTTYTIVSSDVDKILYTTNSSPVTITIPSSLTINQTYEVFQLGLGQVSFTNSSTTLVKNSYEQLKVAEQYGRVMIKYFDTESYQLYGQLSAY